MPRPRASALASFAASASLAVAALALTACKKDGDVPPPPDERPGPTAPAPSPSASAGSMTAPAPVSAAGEARKIFAARCATCHGKSGRGDGAAAVSLQPPPRDYSDAAWQATVTDADLAHVIVAGGAAVGKSSMMPASPDLADKPAVVAELVALIRGFAAK